MRMWKVRPVLLCRQHLLGEHREMHTLVGSIKHGRSIQGHIDRGQVETSLIKRRHDELAAEMRRRDYNHASPLRQPRVKSEGRVVVANSLRDLHHRCKECRRRMWRHANSTERRAIGAATWPRSL